MRKTKIALVVLVLALLVVAQQLGILQRFSDPTRATQTLLAMGPWGYVVFIAVYTALQPFGVPGTAFILAAAFIWPWPIAFAVSMVGTMGASVVGFSFARFIARDWISAKIPQRFRKYEDALARRAFMTVFMLRFVFWMPQLLHAFFGVSKVRFWTHFWASLLGYFIPLLLVSILGQRLFEAFRHAPTWVWIATAIVATLATIVWFLRRKRRASAIQIDGGRRQ